MKISAFSIIACVRCRTSVPMGLLNPKDDSKACLTTLVDTLLNIAAFWSSDGP